MEEETSMTRKFLLLLLLVVIASSNSQARALPKNNKALSNRPQTWDKFIAIIRLKKPALLESATRVGGVLKVDETLKKEVYKEQVDMEKKLALLSSDIKILYRYRLVLNGMAILAPRSLKGKIGGMQGVFSGNEEGRFHRPKVTVLDDQDETLEGQKLSAANSVNFIGSDKVHDQLGFKGKGIRVGVIDTGIDYTHAMFGGPGTEAIYKAVDPDGSSVYFPNKKVVGGIDLVGTEYSAGSGNFALRIPKPDKNPLDEAGHGTHVAGTVAGIGDGINTYSGVAPEAELYAIKLFGRTGSTGEGAILAAFEYAADPSGDMLLDDQLHVVNLSLGSSYGKPVSLYSEAVKNLSNAGTAVVISAGNSGDSSYIVGSPGTVAEAISVAASIDNSDKNWKFNAVKFTNVTTSDEKITEAIEASFTKKIKKVTAAKGKLIHLGIGKTPLTDAQKLELKGNVALIDRGEITFLEKVTLAYNGGAIGVIVANNDDTPAFAMSGSGKIAIPAVMISKALADELKAAMATDEVVANFKSPDLIEKPEIIDTLTGFSSRGPRSIDSLIKPEVSAPGFQILSAAMGKGKLGVPMNGTSMSAPHVAGVMALMKEAFPKESSVELKSRLMDGTVSISNAKGVTYPVSQQGAGRVDVFKAINSSIVTFPQTFSLGEVFLQKSVSTEKEITIYNPSKNAIDLILTSKSDSHLEMIHENTISLAAGQKKVIKVNFTIMGGKATTMTDELDGFLIGKSKGMEVLRVPVLVMANKVSEVKGTKLRVHAASAISATGAKSDLETANTGIYNGDVQAFNFLGTDNKKKVLRRQRSTRAPTCDLESAGYRVVEKKITENNIEKDVKVLQFGFKLYDSVTLWQACELSVSVDANNDGIADQELVGTIHSSLPGLGRSQAYNAFLLNSAKAREIRKKFETNSVVFPGRVDENYIPAIMSVGEMKFYNHSTLAIIEAPLDSFAVDSTSILKVKIAILNNEMSSVEPDDYLGDSTKWVHVPSVESQAGFYGLSEKMSVVGYDKGTFSFLKGSGKENLILYFPQNVPQSWTGLRTDVQSEVMLPEYKL